MNDLNLFSFWILVTRRKRSFWGPAFCIDAKKAKEQIFSFSLTHLDPFLSTVPHLVYILFRNKISMWNKIYLSINSMANKWSSIWFQVSLSVSFVLEKVKFRCKVTTTKKEEAHQAMTAVTFSIHGLYIENHSSKVFNSMLIRLSTKKRIFGSRWEYWSCDYS